MLPRVSVHVWIESPHHGKHGLHLLLHRNRLRSVAPFILACPPTLLSLPWSFRTHSATSSGHTRGTQADTQSAAWGSMGQPIMSPTSTSRARHSARHEGPAVMRSAREGRRVLCKACGGCETRGVHAAQHTVALLEGRRLTQEAHAGPPRVVTRSRSSSSASTPSSWAGWEPSVYQPNATAGGSVEGRTSQVRSRRRCRMQPCSLNASLIPSPLGWSLPTERCDPSDE